MNKPSQKTENKKNQRKKENQKKKKKRFIVKLGPFSYIWA